MDWLTAYILTCLGKADYTYPILGSQFFPSFDVYLQTLLFDWLVAFWTIIVFFLIQLELNLIFSEKLKTSFVGHFKLVFGNLTNLNFLKNLVSSISPVATSQNDAENQTRLDEPSLRKNARDGLKSAIS